MREREREREREKEKEREREREREREGGGGGGMELDKVLKEQTRLKRMTSLLAFQVRTVELWQVSDSICSEEILYFRFHPIFFCISYHESCTCTMTHDIFLVFVLSFFGRVSLLGRMLVIVRVDLVNSLFLVGVFSKTNASGRKTNKISQPLFK